MNNQDPANSKKPYSAVRFTGFLMIGALLGKVFGFLREILLARQLGANFIADSFRGAMTAVLLPISPLQGDMLPGTLVPLHKEWSLENKAPAMFASLCLVMGSIATFIGILVWVFADSYVRFIVGGFGPTAQAMTVSFVHVMTLAMPASVLVSVLACIELALGRVRLTAIRASIQNVSVMTGIILMVYFKNPIAIAWGFSIAMNAVTLFGFIMLCKERQLSLHLITIEKAVSSSKQFFYRVRPLFTHPLFDTCNTLLEKLLASALVVGTVASLDYARTLTDTAVYFISQPIGLAVLRRGVTDDPASRVKAICRPLLHMGLPISTFTVIFATDVVTVVFRRGQFQDQAIALTSHAMQGIGLGIWAAVLGWILIRMLNAAHQNVLAAKVLVASYACNMLVNFAFHKYLGIFGLGLGEATRGIMMLAAGAYYLKCIRLLGLLTLQALPITLALSVIGITVHHTPYSPLIHLILGLGVYALVLIPYLWFVVPELVEPIVKRLRTIMVRYC